MTFLTSTDDSTSMTFELAHIPALYYTLRRVARIATALQPKGISLRFLNHNAGSAGQYDDLKDPHDIEMKVRNVPFNGGTRLGQVLDEKIVQPMIVDKITSGRPERPLFVVIITDGQVTPLVPLSQFPHPQTHLIPPLPAHRRTLFRPALHNPALQNRTPPARLHPRLGHLPHLADRHRRGRHRLSPQPGSRHGAWRRRVLLDGEFGPEGGCVGRGEWVCLGEFFFGKGGGWGIDGLIFLGCSWLSCFWLRWISRRCMGELLVGGASLMSETNPVSRAS